jgi:hypothetical protein
MAYNYLEELYFQTIWNHSIEDAATKSAEITQRIAIEFAEWLFLNYILNSSGKYNGYSNKELYQEFMKSKQPNDAIATS